jgi:hypothetical protein
LEVGLGAAGEAGCGDDDDWACGTDYFEFAGDVGAGDVVDAAVEDDAADCGEATEHFNGFFATVGGEHVELCRLDDELACGDAAGEFTVDDEKAGPDHWLILDTTARAAVFTIPKNCDGLVAVAALDAVFVFANEAKEVLLDGAFVCGVPGDGEAHVEIVLGERGEGDTGGTEVANAGGDEGDAFAGFDEGEDAGPGVGGVDDVGREAGGGAEGNDAVEEDGSHLAVAEDEAFGDEVVDGDGGAGEGMVAGEGDDDGVAIEEFGAEGAVEGGFEGAGEGDVDFAGGEGFHLFGGAHFVEGEFNVWVAFSVVADDAREEAAGAPEEEADGESAGFATERALGNVDGAVGGEEGLAGFGEEELALRSETGWAGGAVEERAAYLALEVGDLLADGGLGDVELATSFGEGAVVGDGAEVAEVS